MTEISSNHGENHFLEATSSIENQEAREWVTQTLLLFDSKNKVEYSAEDLRKKRQEQAEILAHFYTDIDGLAAVIEEIDTIESNNRLKASLFERLAISSLGERSETHVIAEKFILGLLRDPWLLHIFIEQFLPAPLLTNILRKQGIGKERTNLAEYKLNNQRFEELETAMRQTLTGEHEEEPAIMLTENQKELLERYLAYIKTVRTHLENKDTKKNNDGIALIIVDDASTGAKSILVTGLIEAKSHRKFSNSNLESIETQREKAPQELYNLIQLLNSSFLKFYLENTGLADLIPSKIECLSPTELKYSIIHAESISAQNKLQAITRIHLIQLPFTWDEQHLLLKRIQEMKKQ